MLAIRLERPGGDQSAALSVVGREEIAMCAGRIYRGNVMGSGARSRSAAMAWVGAVVSSFACHGVMVVQVYRKFWLSSSAA